MTDIDDMTLDVIKTEIEGMGKAYEGHFGSPERYPEDGYYVYVGDKGQIWGKKFWGWTELDAARAALRYLRERERR